MIASRFAHACLSLLFAAAFAAPALAQGARPSPAFEGRRVFLKLNCYGCHGERAQGGMGPNLRGGETDELDRRIAHGGGEGMPAFQQLVTPSDVDNLRAYIRSLGTSAEPTFVEWWKKTPAR